MRKIKYKVWNEELEEMYTISKEKYLGSTGIVDPYVGHEKAVWLQFTGLTDVNNREIYEGDILRLLNSEVLCEVVYEAPSFCRRWINPKVSSLRGVEMESMAHNTYITYEVIGNVFENPELLKENEK